MNGISFIDGEQILMSLLKGEKKVELGYIEPKTRFYKKEITYVNRVKFCDHCEHVASYILEKDVILNKFICHDKDNEDFKVFDIFNHFNFETDCFHINISLKEDYTSNITTVQACSIFNIIMTSWFNVKAYHIAELARGFARGMLLCECKFGYNVGNFIFDEWSKENSLIEENIDPDILDIMKDKEKIKKFSYEGLMNLAQNHGLHHMSPPIDRDPFELDDGGKIVDIIQIC